MVIEPDAGDPGRGIGLAESGRSKAPDLGPFSAWSAEVFRRISFRRISHSSLEALMFSDAADRDEVSPDRVARLDVPLASACHCIRRDRKV
jgi:hypothetical protein